ncbi:FecR family protein [Phenylobacterium sp.]|uniref:FecR family protein n=1 Tax=Phenylobacterium sp. TaxID=1871053 RepID=UPI0035646D65
MSNPAADVARVQSEAAGWFARLNQLSITTDELRDWRDWKRDEANAAAYAKVEAAWAAAGALSKRPAIQAETAEILQRRPSQTPAHVTFRRYGLPAAITATVVTLGVAVAWLNFQPQPSFTTRVGEQRLVVLDDGSRVRLNTDSVLRVRFRKAERRVILARGEAFFEAAHDAARPFIVEADGTRVHAIGTKFDVRRDGDAVRVTLLEGKVKVAQKDTAGSATLIPNQQLTVADGRVSAPHPTDAAEAAAWTSGRLTFRSVALEDAIAEVNRYAAHKVVLDGPPALGRQPITGVFDTGDTKSFADAVGVLLDLSAKSDSDGVLRLTPRAPSRAPSA